MRSAAKLRRRRMLRLGLASLILFLLAAGVGVFLGYGDAGQPVLAQESAPQPVPPEGAAPPEQVPGGTLGNASDADFWREIRSGIQGTVSIPDK